MDLFNQDPHPNLLPVDGDVRYYPGFLSSVEARSYFDAFLTNIPWKQDELVMFGKSITTARKVAWYGDMPFRYTYSRATKESLPWTDELASLKRKLAAYSHLTFNSCLLNLYHHGGEGMGYHSDDEAELGPNPIIASISLGATRPFSLKHKQSKETRKVVLEPGSLLLMQGSTQHHWVHSLPKTTKVKGPRISLTFRTFISSQLG